MVRMSTCKCCGAKVTGDDKKKYNNKTYCLKCYQGLVREGQEYKQLVSNICVYFSLDKPTGLILKQIKEYKEQMGFVCAGMNYCLWYITEIKGEKLDLQYGISKIKYEYENAEKYFMKSLEIQNSVKYVDNKVTKTVSIKKRKDDNKILFNLDDM